MNRLGVANIYELLDDDNDAGGNESGRKVQAALQKKESVAASATNAANANQASKQGVTQTKPAAASTSGGFGVQKKQQRGERPVGDNNKARQDRPPRADRGERRPPRSLDAAAPLEGDDLRADRRRNTNRQGPSDRPFGEKRNNPRVEGEVRGNRRLFDRHSGTGRSQKENKKGGAGKGNWGTPVDDQQVALEEGAKVEAEQTKKEGEEATPAEETAQTSVKTEGQTEAEEEDEKVRTLDEYLTEKKGKVPAAALPAQRVVDESEQQTKWKDFVPLKREEEDLFSVEGKQKKEKGAKETGSKKTVSADQVIKFQKENPKKNRERATGAPAKTEKRGPRGQAPSITDEKSFPALSPKA